MIRKMLLFILYWCPVCLTAQVEKNYWNTKLVVNAWRLPPPPVGYSPVLQDLDKDGDPDILYSITRDDIPVLWIDDDDDMKWEQLEGDTDNDCLLIDRNKDGRYGGLGDLIIDWVDNDNDSRADMQIIADYPKVRTAQAWPNGHFMIVLDTDKDNIFNYIDWNSFEIRAWDRNGLSDFMLDYSGRSAFLKIHVATYTMDNLKLNWENPFLFYDPDNDGLSEIAIRFVASPKMIEYSPAQTNEHNVSMTGQISWISMAWDLDNDNCPGNEFDYDMSISFRGAGFNFMDQVHTYKNMKGLPGTDSFFLDPRWRQQDELIYPDHEKAPGLIYNRGKWDKAYFVYDEDDDCNRWERVEFYDPLDLFKSGSGKGGLDNNPQADIAGDRGEWDLNNSGKGNLYIGKFDGRIHLYGAEWGAWRIDQQATYYQGWDRKFLNSETGRFATVKYEDSDNDGFLDKLLYDLDGDTVFEDSAALAAIGIDDRNEVIDVSKYTYQDYKKLQKHVADGMWTHALAAAKAAEKFGLNISWYAKLMQTVSTQQKYSNGYWLQFYIYRDLRDLFARAKNVQLLKDLDKAYYGSNWKLLYNRTGNQPVNEKHHGPQ